MLSKKAVLTGGSTLHAEDLLSNWRMCRSVSNSALRSKLGALSSVDVLDLCYGVLFWMSAIPR